MTHNSTPLLCFLSDGHFLPSWGALWVSLSCNPSMDSLYILFSFPSELVWLYMFEHPPHVKVEFRL